MPCSTHIARLVFKGTTKTGRKCLANTADAVSGRCGYRRQGMGTANAGLHSALTAIPTDYVCARVCVCAHAHTAADEVEGVAHERVCACVPVRMGPGGGGQAGVTRVCVGVRMGASSGALAGVHKRCVFTGAKDRPKLLCISGCQWLCPQQRCEPLHTTRARKVHGKHQPCLCFLVTVIQI